MILLQAPVPPRVNKALLPPIEAPGTKGWTKAGITPDNLARRADARLAATKNSINEWIARINLPTGNGRAQGRNVLWGPGRFRVETMRFGGYRDDLDKTIWVGNAGKTRVLTVNGWERRANYRALPTPLASRFLRSFDDVLMRGTQGARPITTLLASARKLGFTPVVERRKYARFNELRLVLTKGVTRYAVSWREEKMLPNQVWVQSVDAKGKPTRLFWSCAWGVKNGPLTAEDVKNFHPASDRRY